MLGMDNAINKITDIPKLERSNVLNVFQPGRKPYQEIWDLQKILVEKRKDQFISDTLILVEHDPVYTLGKNADENHLLQSRPPDVPVYTIERGGDVTFHGPGQLVGYPILDLHNHRLSVSWYMRSLEEVLIKTLAHFDIPARRHRGLTGVWVLEDKIAALGVRLSHWISMHGFAMNVNVDLNYFDGIIPCGIFEYGVTSMNKILKRDQDINEVQDVIIQQFTQVFEFLDVDINKRK